MPEVLEIQIQDKSSSSNSAAGSSAASSSPPRPPAAGSNAPGPARPRSASPAAAGSAASSMQTALAAGKKNATVVDEILAHLGLDKQAAAFRQLLDFVAGRAPAQKASEPGPAAQSEKKAANAPVAAPAAKAAHAPASAGLVSPNATPRPAGNGDARTPSAQSPYLPVDGGPIRSVVEQGFFRVEKQLSAIAGYFADLPEPGPAATPEMKAAATPVAAPAAKAAHAPASAGLAHPATAASRPAGSGDTAAPSAAKNFLAMPSAAHGPPKAPLMPARSTAAGKGAAAGAEAAEAGEAVAAGAEAAGGALASVAAAAAPVGAVLLVTELAAKATSAAFDHARQVTEAFGHQLSAAAGNDYLGMFKSGLNALHSPLKDIPIVGKVFESQLQATIAPIKAFTEVTEAFTKRAHELAGFSPNIAVADQMGSVRSLLDDFKEADTLGPDMARMLEAESSLQHEIRELLLPIKKILVDVLAAVVQMIAQTVKEVRTELILIRESSVTIAELLLDAFTGQVWLIPGLLKDIKKRIDDAIAQANKSDLDDADLRNKVLGMTRDLLESKWDKGAAADPWAGARPDARPNIPIIPGFGGL